MKPYNTPKTKKEEVQQMFDNIAPSYDNINHILSLSIDKLWRRRVVKIVKRLKPQRVMDLATGTGDLAIKMAKRMPKTSI
ncbi:MAG: class I SAM-dependent methyltransferase, partial [Alistipes sp.]|nr:class I SAM-dependent methyltransferase [Alistipes sp.]